jgi:hypothetical protein
VRTSCTRRRHAHYDQGRAQSSADEQPSVTPRGQPRRGLAAGGQRPPRPVAPEPTIDRRRSNPATRIRQANVSASSRHHHSRGRPQMGFANHLRRAILPLMRTAPRPDHSSASPDLRVEAIAIKVVPTVHGHSLWRRLTRLKVRRGARGVLWVALALAALGALIATALPSSSASRRGSAGLARAPGAEKAAIAAAFGYPYPLRCLTITISAGDPDYARAFIDRTRGCRQYHGYINASFHRVAGAWRLVLDEGQLYVPNNFLMPLPPRGSDAPEQH